MAQRQGSSTVAPDTLPADFFDQKSSPDTLPSNFFEKKDTQEQPGFLKRLGQSFGVPTSEEELKAATPSRSDAINEAILGPALPVARGIGSYLSKTYENALSRANEVRESVQNIRQGGPVRANIGKAAYGMVSSELGSLPFVGPTAQQVGQDVANKNYAGAAGGATGIAAQVLGPKVIEKGVNAVGAIPSAERAGANFQNLKQTIGQHPVFVTDEMSRNLNDLRQASAIKTPVPATVQNLIDRLDPMAGGGNLTYEEARRYASEISRLSAEDKFRMTPNTKRMVGNLSKSLNGAIQDTADVAGKGTQLASAMKEYHQAMQLKGFSETAIDLAWKAALGSLGIGAAKKLWESF